MAFLKKYYKIIIGLALVLLVAAAYVLRNNEFLKDLLAVRMSNTLEKVESEPILAKFSFTEHGENMVIDEFKHYRLKLAQPRGIDYNERVVESWQADSIPIIITVETWGSNAVSSYKSNPMEKLLEGYFDEALKELCVELIKNKKQVYIRFNPEVEVPYKRYPWQGYVLEYVKAFEYLSEKCKSYAPQIKIVWGAAGYPGVLEYYPGDEVVDVASVILKSDSEMMLDVYPKDYSLEYDLKRRLHRLRFLDKPIFVFGSKQTPKNEFDKNVVTTIVDQIEQERSVIYSSENFKRPSPKRKADQNLKIGLYDPNNFLNTEPMISVEHLFVDFSNLNDDNFEERFKKVLGRKHDIIVTFEPFRLRDGSTDLNVLQHVTEGKYDEEISAFYDIILNSDQQVYLRYAHEMEIPITRYPWQSQDPIVYIKSFRYFMNFKGELPVNIKRVWGPAGDRGSIEWYPGNDVVDIMSIAIYGLPDKNITDPNMQESFKTIFNRKTRRIRFIDKPLFITEFGVKGPEDYQTKWMEDAARVLREHPEVLGINYFNMSDTPKAWGDIKPPDWSITKQTLHHFYNTLNETD